MHGLKAETLLPGSAESKNDAGSEILSYTN